eukprot:755206-Hanusia_phi.AAC.7
MNPFENLSLQDQIQKVYEIRAKGIHKPILDKKGSSALINLYLQIGKLQNTTDILEVMRLIFYYAIPEDQESEMACPFDVPELCSSVLKNYEVFTNRVKVAMDDESKNIIISKFKMVASLVDTQVEVSSTLGKSMIEKLYKDWICDVELGSTQWIRVKYYALDTFYSLCKQVDNVTFLLRPTKNADETLSNIISFLVVGSWPNGLKGVQLLRLLSDTFVMENQGEKCLIEKVVESWIRGKQESNVNTSTTIENKLVQDLLSSGSDQKLFRLLHDSAQKQVELFEIEKIVGNDLEMRVLKGTFSINQALICLAAMDSDEFEAEMIEIFVSNIKCFNNNMDDPRKIECCLERPVVYDNRGDLKVSIVNERAAPHDLIRRKSSSYFKLFRRRKDSSMEISKGDILLCEEVTPVSERLNFCSPCQESSLKPEQIDFQTEEKKRDAACDLPKPSILSNNFIPKNCDVDGSSLVGQELCKNETVKCLDWQRNNQKQIMSCQLNFDSNSEIEEISSSQEDDFLDDRSEDSGSDVQCSPMKLGITNLEGKLHDLCKFTFTKKRKSLEMHIQAEKLNLEKEIDQHQFKLNDQLKRVMQNFANQNEKIQARRKKLKSLMRENYEAFRSSMVKAEFDKQRQIEDFHRKKTFMLEQVMQMKRDLPNRVSQLHENCFQYIDGVYKETTARETFQNKNMSELNALLGQLFREK